MNIIALLRKSKRTFVRNEMYFVTALSKLFSKLGSNYSAAAYRGVTGNANFQWASFVA